MIDSGVNYLIIFTRIEIRINRLYMKGINRLNCFHCFAIQLIFVTGLLIPNTEGIRAYTPEQNEWNQFRGGDRNGRVVVSEDEAGRLTPFPELLWEKEIGSGFSEVAVANGRVYLLMAEKIDSLSGSEVLVCMDADTGEEKWRTVIDTVFIDVDDWGDGPRSTPAIDEDYVFCFSASGKLAALDKTDGSVRWSVSFVEEFGSTLPRWGYATSPLLVNDMVVMEVGGKEGMGFAAFCRQTGSVAWQAGHVNSGYNSGMTAIIDGQTRIIFANGARLHAYSEQGDSLWTFTMPLRSPMALPMFIPPNKLFVSAANDAGSFIAEIDDFQAVVVMESSRMRNDWSSSSYKDGYLYGFNVATLVCMDAETGERKWLRRGFGKGSLIMVHHWLFILSDQGQLTIAKATPEEYTEITSIEALEGRSWTAPSYANGKIYLRNHTKMACYQIIQPDPSSSIDTSEK